MLAHAVYKVMCNFGIKGAVGAAQYIEIGSHVGLAKIEYRFEKHNQNLLSSILIVGFNLRMFMISMSLQVIKCFILFLINPSTGSLLTISVNFRAKKKATISDLFFNF